MQYAVATDVANELSKVRHGTRLVADVRTNSLIVAYVSAADLSELADCIAKLDIPVAPAK